VNLRHPIAVALHEHRRVDLFSDVKLVELSRVFHRELHGHGFHPVADLLVLDGGDFSLRVQAKHLAMQGVAAKRLVLSLLFDWDLLAGCQHKQQHDRDAEGRDIVLGVIETHERAETAALVRDLETVPLREVQYRGTVLKELDLDAIITRKPDIAVVDELAHTNAPGSRHEKRYQDVEELLENGISVITAVNIQHLEGLKPLVKRITGVEVKETLPDSLLARADQVVTVDVAIEELRQRLSPVGIVIDDNCVAGEHEST